MISVIIPSFNHELFIKEAIQSVLDQTYKELELIIIDDGSTDKSVEIIKSFSDNRITLITQKNEGAHSAINKGLDIAKGKYISILNSDDIYHPQRLEICASVLENYPEIDMVSSYIDLINIAGKTIGHKKGWDNLEPWPMPDKEKSFYNSSHFFQKLLCGNFIATTSNMVFRKTLIFEIGKMNNLRFAHDWDFALRASINGECYIVEQFLVKYRLHNTNTISTNKDWLMVENAWIWASYIPEVFKRSAFESPGNEMDLIQRFKSSANFLKLEPLIILIGSLQTYHSKKYILDNPDTLKLLIKAAQDLPFQKEKASTHSSRIARKVKSILRKIRQ
jgi:glycosyltransferase involved in cell wall biosynthesis